MCGFCGIVGPETRAAPGDVVVMARTLRHRGPDDFGTWSGAFRSRGVAHSVALGHTRLSILDLSESGHQPMATADGSVVIAYNGEVYNFRALRAELRDLGHQFRSESDTEVLLESYKAWGVEAFERWNGMFALALWDATRSRLLLVRDRLGIKPLYYRLHREVLTFGSELAALRSHQGFEPRIDRAALGRFLRYGYVTGRETIYADTRRLLPGEFLVWEDGGLETRSYWRLCDPPEEPPPDRFETAVERLDELLGDAVERRLVADVPLGAFLSGGVDSSTVVALMQERAPGKVRTFSIGFREREFDEAPFARAVAKHLGTDHTELHVDRSQALAVAHELPDLYDEPFADPSAIPTTLLSRLTREHVTVALSGDGGDELFGGYDRYAKLRRLLPLFRWPRPARHLLAAFSPWVPHAALRNGLSHLAAPSVVALAERLRSHFPDTDLAAACGPEGARPSALFAETFAAASTGDDIARVRFGDCRTYMVDDILTKVDRASMSVALEARVPILDHHVVHFGLSLPREILWHRGKTKAPLRGVLYRRVPRELIERPKRGFGIPLATLLDRELREWSALYLAPQRLAEEGNLDPDGAARLCAQASPDDPVGLERLWNLLCFQRWFARTHRGESLA